MPILPNCVGMERDAAEAKLAEVGLDNVSVEGTGTTVTRQTTTPSGAEPGDIVPKTEEINLECP